MFVGIGEFLMDPNALRHIAAAGQLGHIPYLLTNGQLLTEEVMDKLLESGVRQFRISVDAITDDEYAGIRKGGEFRKILLAFEYLKKCKTKYPDIVLETNNVVLSDEADKLRSMCDFWTGKIDRVNFLAEYVEAFHFKRLLAGKPESRRDCSLALSLLPSGHISPCNGVTTYEQYFGDLEWLPHVDCMTPREAYDYLVAEYDNPNSKLRRLCENCEWWLMFCLDERGDSPVYQNVSLAEPERSLKIFPSEG